MSSSSAEGTARRKVLIDDSQLDRLMDLDIMQAAVNMGFPLRAIKATLKRKIEITGVPFFDLENCVQQILVTLPMHEQQDEAQTRQNSKMSRYNQERDTVPSTTETPQDSFAQSESSDESSIGTASDSNLDHADVSASSVDIVEFPLSARNPSHSYSSQTSGTSSLGSDSSDEEQHTPPTILENRTGNNALESPLDATLSSTSSNDLESLASLNDVPSSTRQSVDIVEFPLVRGYSIPPVYSSQTSGTSSMGSDSLDEQLAGGVHADPNTTSTPRGSPVMQMFSDLPPLPQASSSSSSSGYGTLHSTSPSSSSSEMLESVQPAVMDSSREMLHQIDQVLSRAEIEKKKVMKILSSGSNSPDFLVSEENEKKKSACEILPSEDKSGGSDRDSSSLQDEDVGAYKQMLSESKKKGKSNIWFKIKHFNSYLSWLLFLDSNWMFFFLVAELEKENERLKDMRTCRVCMDQEMSLVFLPCLHMATCATCGVSMSACPICRAEIVHIIRPNIVA